jgi:hypothetical protein
MTDRLNNVPFYVQNFFRCSCFLKLQFVSKKLRADKIAGFLLGKCTI